MSTEQLEQQEMSGTKPVAEHAWLDKLVGDWKVESEMSMPDGTSCKGEGKEKVVNFGGLWSFGEGQGTMPDGNTMEYRTALGYDVTFNEYRGCWFANVSSHLWKYVGTLSADGKKMTLDCRGPNMMGEGEANYQDVIELIDDNHRTLTSFGQDEGGKWCQFMKAKYTRI